VASRSSVEVEYKSMVITCCEVTWLLSLLMDLEVKHLGPVSLICDNQAAFVYSCQRLFQKCTKHTKVDCHFVRD